ncbi:MAG: hypothetical protein WDO73_27535 [Ignavibacteriota bacterium]
MGDVERAAKRDWEFDLTLCTRRRIQLKQFGAAFSTMSEALLAAWRDRTVQCLLLEDLEEVARYSATAGLRAHPAPAEIRLYKSNIAVLPLEGTPIQWRLAEVDSISFDESTYSVTLQSAGDKLTISKLAKKTDEFLGNLEGALGDLRSHEAEALHDTFPFLDPDQLQQLQQVMPEGRSVALSALKAIHAELPDAVIALAVSEPLRPYFDALRKRSVGDGLMTGFKFIRSDEEKASEESEPAKATEAAPDTEGKDDRQALFFWFFFPLPDGRVAWEATTGSGRATYFFDAPPPVDEAVKRLTRGLALINFRREPVYLSDESLEQEHRYRRYAIGSRKLADLRTLRAAFRGRAIHSSIETWTSQVEAGGTR